MENHVDNHKIICDKCNAKFLVLGRQEIICTQCSNTIVVNEIKIPSPSKHALNLDELDVDYTDLDEEDNIKDAQD